MDNPFVKLARSLALHKNASAVSTAMRPLSSIRSAVVLVDASCGDDISLLRDVRLYFKDRSVDCKVFAFDVLTKGKGDGIILRKRDINWFGRVRRSAASEAMLSDADLFISLVQGDLFAAEYAAKCSRAAFKIGCNRLYPQVFDIMVSAPQETSCNGKMILETATGLLEKIR